ncbi:MAG: ABC transporter substrate-binding protein [Syntrophomonadaceae bacterium]|jgi:raffinose/stachyose/melibiose transport system substrate-binding protein|nr:ABC transporter substrate-binding protein [Syntrophomonadaceae bacterium]
MKGRMPHKASVYLAEGRQARFKKMNLPRCIAALLAVCMCLAAVTACGSLPGGAQEGTAAEPQEARKKDVTLTFGSHQSGLPTSGVVQELAKEYEAQTGVKIDFQIVSDAQWRDLLKVKLDAGEAYDIMNVDADPLSLVSRINPEQNCVELTDQEWVSRMNPIVLDGISVNSKVYGIQFNGIRRSVFFYNKKIFADLALQIPTTYEAFKQVCQAVKDSGLTPIYEATQNGWHQVLPVCETGSYYVTLYDDLYEKLNKNEMNIKEVKEIEIILNEMKEFAELGFFGDNFMNQSVEGAKEAFAKGEVAMFNNDTGWAAETEAEFPETAGNIGIFVAPWSDNQTVSSNPTCNAYFINKNSKYVEEAKGFFAFLAEPDSLAKFLEGAPNLVSLCWKDTPSKEKPEYEAYFNSLPAGVVMQVGVSYIDPQWMDIGKDIDAMYVGIMTPEEIMDNISLRRDELAELAQDPAWVN